ncbi:MAG: hypothetical protein IPQ07_37645 [Myxococcales bacterium]|nr:hypothetical protein [Myxococcales bacterium]
MSVALQRELASRDRLGASERRDVLAALGETADLAEAEVDGGGGVGIVGDVVGALGVGLGGLDSRVP